MGLLDDYGVDMDEIEAPSFDVPDDIYEFEVSDFFLQQGTAADPDKNVLVIEYSLGDGGKSKREWFGLPKDASAPTDKELQTLGFFKNRLKDLGVAPEAMNGIEPDDLVGLRGTLQVYTNKGYQNIKNVKLTSDDDEMPGAKEGPGNKARAFVEDEPVVPKKRPARPAAKPAPEEGEVGDEEQAEEPEEAPAPKAASKTAAASTAKARAAGVRPNPFG